MLMWLAMAKPTSRLSCDLQEQMRSFLAVLKRDNFESELWDALASYYDLQQSEWHNLGSLHIDLYV